MNLTHNMTLRLATIAALAFAPITARAADAPVAGMWDATIQVKEGAIPFRLQLSGPPDDVKATYFDGEHPVHASTGGHLRDGALEIDFASYASKLEAHVEAGVLRGTIGALPFEAHRHRAQKVAAVPAPPIGGVWEVPLDSAKGEKAWRLIVDQKPNLVAATILRIDGDTGTISGTYDGARFNLSRFAGERPVSMQITTQADGSLSLVLIDGFGRRDLKALRPDAARKAGLAAPSDPTRHTSVTNPAEPLRFSGVDLAGHPVSNEDARFKGKVVLLNITGSWCPNCHDEAPFLAELDAKYRAKGLEVVGLDFEGGPEDLKDLSRLKAFIARYGLKYTVLVAGVRTEVNAKLPQAMNLNAWPTTFFLGRDGKFRGVHVGFPSRGSGEFDRQARAEMVQEVEKLLAEPG